MLILLASTIMTFSLSAEGNYPNPDRQMMFSKMKEAELQNHQERMRILNESDSCIRSAGSPEALRQCNEREKAQHQQMKQQQHEKMEQFRQQHDQFRQNNNQNPMMGGGGYNGQNIPNRQMNEQQPQQQKGWY